MFVISPSLHIIQHLKELLSEIQVPLHWNNDTIIHMLKIKLIQYFEKQLNNSYPEIIQEIDNTVDKMLPVSSEEIQNAVNDVVNQMLDEIKKEIISYFNNQVSQTIDE